MERYRALIDEDELDIEIIDGHVRIDGKDYPVDVGVLPDGRMHFLVDGKGYAVFVQRNGQGMAEVSVAGSRTSVIVKSKRELLLEKYGIDASESNAGANISAPMPGLVLRIAASEGDEVEQGDPLVVLEAMKMENELVASVPGVVTAIHVAEGDAVAKNELLIELEASS